MIFEGFKGSNAAAHSNLEPVKETLTRSDFECDKFAKQVLHFFEPSSLLYFGPVGLVCDM